MLLLWELQTFSHCKWHRGSEGVNVALMHFQEEMQTELLGLFHMPHSGSCVIHLQTEVQVNCVLNEQSYGTGLFWKIGR